jgi:hypothetical protein
VGVVGAGVWCVLGVIVCTCAAANQAHPPNTSSIASVRPEATVPAVGGRESRSAKGSTARWLGVVKLDARLSWSTSLAASPPPDPTPTRSCLPPPSAWPASRPWRGAGARQGSFTPCCAGAAWGRLGPGPAGCEGEALAGLLSTWEGVGWWG